MSEEKDLRGLFAVVSSQLQVATPERLPAGMSPEALLQQLRHWVAQEISKLLRQDKFRLFSILYRVDVREESVKQILSSAPAPEIPSLLADLLIERQLQKIRIRRAYREKGKTGIQ